MYDMQGECVLKQQEEETKAEDKIDVKGKERLFQIYANINKVQKYLRTCPRQN